MKIFIENLEFEAIIGILDFERESAQRVIVHCEIDYDGGYVDYSKIREFLINSVKNEKFLLIEDALEFLASGIKEMFAQITKVRLKISKTAIFDDCVVGAEILK